MGGSGSAPSPAGRHATGRVLSLLLVAVIGAACGPGSSSAAPSVVLPGGSPDMAPPSATAAAGVSPPAALVRAPDQAALSGAGVMGPTVVTQPDGTFLMLRAEDTEPGGALLHSADGTQWSGLPGLMPGMAGTRVQALACNGPVLVLAGGTPPAGGGSVGGFEPAMWSSSDGLRWDLEPKAAVVGMVPNLLAASPGAFLGVAGSTGQAWLGDPSGRSWTAVKVMPGPDPGMSINRVASIGNGFLAVGGVGLLATAWRSTDGRTWARLPFNRPDTSANRIAAVGDRIVVSGSVIVADPTSPDGEASVAAAWISRDGGSTWRDAGLNLAGADTVAVFAVGDGFLAAILPHESGRQPLAMFRSVRDGPWEPVRLADGGTGLDLGWPSSIAVRGSRVVLVGSTLGTGAGGDRAVVWTGDAG